MKVRATYVDPSSIPLRSLQRAIWHGRIARARPPAPCTFYVAMLCWGARLDFGIACEFVRSFRISRLVQVAGISTLSIAIIEWKDRRAEPLRTVGRW